MRDFVPNSKGQPLIAMPLQRMRLQACDAKIDAYKQDLVTCSALEAKMHKQ